MLYIVQVIKDAFAGREVVDMLYLQSKSKRVSLCMYSLWSGTVWNLLFVLAVLVREVKPIMLYTVIIIKCTPMYTRYTRIHTIYSPYMHQTHL